MKKLLSYFSAICLSLLILTACGGPSWNQERAQELSSKEFSSLTPQDFDDMLDLLEGFCFSGNAVTTGSDEWSTLTEEQRDEQRAAIHLYMNLSGRANSMAYATKRVVSDDQVKAYEDLIERIKNKQKEKRNNK